MTWLRRRAGEGTQPHAANGYPVSKWQTKAVVNPANWMRQCAFTIFPIFSLRGIFDGMRGTADIAHYLTLQFPTRALSEQCHQGQPFRPTG